MPFTLSHPAATAAFWPFVRRGLLPLSALAIGAIAPDFEYFLHLRPLALWSHSPIGLVAFCLPAGLLILAAWEFIVRDPVRHFLGLGAAPRPVVRNRQWWACAVVALVLGAATHVLWDGLTHDGGWGLRLLPALRTRVLPFRGRPMTWFVLLDYASTVVGGLVVLAWLARGLRRAGAWGVFARSVWRWLVLLALTGAALATGLWNGSRGPSSVDYWSGELWLARVGVGAMLGLGVALIGFGVLDRVARRPGVTPQPPDNRRN